MTHSVFHCVYTPPCLLLVDQGLNAASFHLVPRAYTPPPCLHTPVLPVGRTFLRKQPDHSVQLYSVAVGRWSALTKHMTAALGTLRPKSEVTRPSFCHTPCMVAPLPCDSLRVYHALSVPTVPCSFLHFPIQKTFQFFARFPDLAFTFPSPLVGS